METLQADATPGVELKTLATSAITEWFPDAPASPSKALGQGYKSIYHSAQRALVLAPGPNVQGERLTSGEAGLQLLCLFPLHSPFSLNLSLTKFLFNL